MKIKHILISQPAPAVLERSPFSEIVSKHAVSLDFNPFIRVEGVSAKEFRSQRVDILSHTAVIFTSRTTIDNFFRICEECRITVPETMKYFCITEAVALYLQKYIVYRKRKIFFGKSTFAELMDVILKHKEEKFVIPLSEPHKPEIPKLLDKARVKYDKLILARTVGADLSGLDISKYDLLVFYSPSEISTLTGTFGDRLPETARIAVFGASTAKAAVDAGLNVSVLAPTQNTPSMTMAIHNFIVRVNAGEAVDVSEDLKKMLASLTVGLPKAGDSRRKAPARTGAGSRKETGPASAGAKAAPAKKKAAAAAVKP